MANQEHVHMLLHKGVQRWNSWRLMEPTVRPDLSSADLHGADVRGADLSETNLFGANLQGTDLRQTDFRRASLIGVCLRGMDLSQSNFSDADLRQADLSGANLTGAEFTNANLIAANLSGATLCGAMLYSARLGYAHLDGADFSNSVLLRAELASAYLRETRFSGANLREANFTRADLRGAQLNGADLSGACLNFADLSQADLTGAAFFGTSCLRTDFSQATLIDCLVYGISAWDVTLDGATQRDLRISADSTEAGIAVDNVEVAQFLYLLLHNDKMRAVLDTITSKVVLILGRFSDERKPILDALREVLRRHPNGYVPVLFDFEPQADKPVLETVKTLANLARFVIADLTDPQMVRAELTALTMSAQSVPIQSIIQGDDALPTEYDSWALARLFLPVHRYVDLSDLLANLNESVITPVEAHVQARRL